MATVTPSRSSSAPAPTPPEPRERRPGRVWWRAYRHHLRLLRNMAIAWIVVLGGIGAGVVATFEDRLPTEADRQAAAAAEGVPTFEALLGRLVEVGTVDGFTLSRWGVLLIAVAVWGMLAAGRLLRGAEERGHVEPLRAGALSPRGLLGSAVAAMLTWFAIFAVVVGAGHSAAGMDPATSWALGATLGLLAASFAAVGALASQMVASRRWAMTVTGAVLGLALVGRVFAASAATPDWVWWTTPLGWTGFLHPVDEAQLTVVGAFAALAVVLLAAAFALARRDLHAGVVGGVERSVTQPRPVGDQLGLSTRLTSRAVSGWAAVLAGFAFLFSLMAADFADVMVDAPEGAAVLERMGYPAIDTPEGVLAVALGLFFFVGVALFAAAQTAAMREEEASWRIEHLLARPVGRTRWLATRTLAAAIGIVVLSLAIALALWAGTALGGAALAIDDALLAGINLIPAAVLFLGLGVLLLGLAPRLTAALAYGLVIAAFLLDFVGALLDLPEAALELSPFHHLASVPAVDFEPTAAAIMLVIGVVFAVVGVAAFRRRDLKEA